MFCQMAGWRENLQIFTGMEFVPLEYSVIMVCLSVEEPERIKDIGYVLKMVTDKDIIPDEFRELYETFCNTLKIRR